MPRPSVTLARASAGAFAALIALSGPAAPARAQNPPRGAVRGVVRSTLGGAVPYAVVVLEPGFPRRFTDDSGAFAFSGLAAGTYHLLARQVGFKPLDTTVVVSGDSAVTVVASLEHLVIQLDEIRVVARAGDPRHCTEPGPPDPEATPGLAAVFGQLRQNAERYWMLADSYPAIFRMERRSGRPDYYNREFRPERTDTVELRTDARWHYAPGRVVTDVAAARGGTEMQVNLPELPDFADSGFLANHCFRVAGLERRRDRTYLRLDFRAADRIRDPDTDGSAFLDPETLLIQLLTVRLTRPERAVTTLEGMEVTVTFREVVPSLVLPDRISSVQSFRVRAASEQHIEEQRMVGFTFLRPLPTRRP